MSAPPAVLRFPLTPAQAKGRDVVTDPHGGVVMTVDASDRGRQADVSSATGAPLGRIVQVKGHQWRLIAPGTGLPVADAETRWGVHVRIGAGPAGTVKGRGDEWDLVWARTTLLSARRTPRKVATRRLDVWVTDPACTPAVVAFVVHVRRWWQADEATTQLIIQQTTTPPPA